ncbi:MAG: TIGR03617 family F420-dependent LLM class oxidoreductase [Chloroflexi bacterium]|nr:TIGR03617 family F420-dependent LLM class oxidoreductase [Chloroflexota bacterium]
MPMKVGAQFRTEGLADVQRMARWVEEQGIGAIWISEANHDAFLPLALAAAQTTKALLATNIALAFPRSPMVTAITAWDLQAFSRGRFMLGLGTQVKPHIERRFSVKWDPPVPKMREIAQSLRAIWDCWQKNTPLNYRGQYYTFSLMPPRFNPGPIQHPRIPVLLAAVNPRMCNLVGEVADGILVHPLNSKRYVQEIILPAVREGAAKAGRTLTPLEVCVNAFVATGATKEEMEASKKDVRNRIAFYGSTPAYAPILRLHGWDDLHSVLHKKSREGDWQGMAKDISDEVLDAFAVVGRDDEVPHKLKERYEGLATQLIIDLGTGKQHEALWKRLVNSLQ